MTRDAGYIVLMEQRRSPLTVCVTPLTVRVFDLLPVGPAQLGLAMAGGMLLLFFVGRALLDGGAGSTPGDLRLAMIHILLTAYVIFAYAYLVMSARRAAAELRPLIEPGARAELILEGVGSYRVLGLLIAAAGALAIYLYGTEITTVDTDPWVWSQNNYDSRWMRVTGPLFAVWASGFLYAMVAESSRLSRLCAHLVHFDLFELHAHRGLVRVGLSNALLLLGMVSVLMLFLMEPGFTGFIWSLSVGVALYAWLCLVLPLRGIRRQIARAKESELAWCRQALREARDQLRGGGVAQRSVMELAAYMKLVESIRNWPFDSPTLIRFALYLLIPLGSMLGGALVERGIERFLF
jgi:hypothetical protein